MVHGGGAQAPRRPSAAQAQVVTTAGGGVAALVRGLERAAPVANGARPRRGTMTLTDVAVASEVYDEIDQLLIGGASAAETEALERERLQAELAETRRRREAAEATIMACKAEEAELLRRLRPIPAGKPAGGASVGVAAWGDGDPPPPPPAWAVGRRLASHTSLQ